MKFLRRLLLAVSVALTWLAANEAYRGHVLLGGLGVAAGMVAIFTVCWFRRSDSVAHSFVVNGIALLAEAYLVALWTPRVVTGDNIMLWSLVGGAGFMTFGLACMVAAAMNKAFQK